jgi:hypothetical protein
VRHRLIPLNPVLSLINDISRFAQAAPGCRKIDLYLPSQNFNFPQKRHPHREDKEILKILNF